jgi:hypothetical protein
VCTFRVGTFRVAPFVCTFRVGHLSWGQPEKTALYRVVQEHLLTFEQVLRPPLANDRLKILDDKLVRLELKKPWSDGTSWVEMPPLALIARLAALVPPPQAASH